MNKILLVIFLMFGWTLCGASAQTVDAIGGQIKTAEAEIALINKQLAENKGKQNDQAKAIDLLDKKINTRTRLVVDIDRRVAELREQRGAEGVQLEGYNRKLKDLKSLMAKMLRDGYKHTFVVNSFPALSIASEQQTEVIRRQIKYFATLIAVQVHSIDSLGRVLGVRIDEIRADQASLDALLVDKNKEMALLKSEKKQLATIRAQLQNQESGLRQQADHKRKRVDELQRQISNAISRESRPRIATAINIALAQEFSSNKGRLPSPLTWSTVVDNYGLHNHPTQSKIKVDNKGVNLKTSAGANVTAVFRGEVRAVFWVEGMGSSVIIRHGDYLTVYANMASVDVKVGQTISTGQMIGTLNGNELHFEVWKETTNLNPQSWVRL